MLLVFHTWAFLRQSRQPLQVSTARPRACNPLLLLLLIKELVFEYLRVFTSTWVEGRLVSSSDFFRAGVMERRWPNYGDLARRQQQILPRFSAKVTVTMISSRSSKDVIRRPRSLWGGTCSLNPWFGRDTGTIVTCDGERYEGGYRTKRIARSAVPLSSECHRNTGRKD